MSMSIIEGFGSSDAALVKQAVAGKRESFAKIVGRYQSLICSIAYSATGSLSESEDVAQETFLAAWKKLSTLQEPAKLRPWLCRIARNLIYHAQQRRRRQPISCAELEEASASRSPEASPCECAINKEEEAILWRSIEQIPEIYREPLVLFYRERQSIHRVAQRLGLSEDAVKQRLARGRKMLHEQVLAFVEGALENTRPGQKFTLAVIAALSVPKSSAQAAMIAGPAHSLPTAAAKHLITMTTFQKTLILATLTLGSIGIYKARQAATLQTEVQSLRQQVASLDEANRKMEQLKTAMIPVTPSAAPSPTAAHLSLAEEWGPRLLALNTNAWRAAFACGQQLAVVTPGDGLAILATNWNYITNVSARQQLLKAFDFANHKYLPAVLDVALHDASPEVQNWALQYLKGVAFQDFSGDYGAALRWTEARRGIPLSAALSDGLNQAVETLSGSNADQIRAQLEVLGSSNLSDFKDIVSSSGLLQVLGQLAKNGDARIAQLALRAAGRERDLVSDDWLREVALPLLAAENPSEIRAEAASLLGGPGRDWAVQPLLDALTASVYSADPPHVAGSARSFYLAQAIAEIGSPATIPKMIALIEADPSAVYDIGYFGLSKLTGVEYEKTHNGTWWRQWWSNNKQRFPPETQSLDIPHLPPVPQSDLPTTGGQPVGRAASSDQ